MTRAYLGGTFDGLHVGHINLFRWAKRNFDEVIVSLNRGEFVERYKKRPTIHSLTERVTMLTSLKYIDGVVVNTNDEDSRPSISRVNPTHLVNGSDWTPERLIVQMNLTADFLYRTGIKIVIYPFSLRIHSSDISRKILEQKLCSDSVMSREYTPETVTASNVVAVPYSPSQVFRKLGPVA